MDRQTDTERERERERDAISRLRAPEADDATVVGRAIKVCSFTGHIRRRH